jgi:two-component system cell cycle sensor histidine kinase/response regulator CckA
VLRTRLIWGERGFAVWLGITMNSNVGNSRNAAARRICRSILDAVTDAVLIFDARSFRIIDANKKASELYGYSRRELLRKELRELTTELPRRAEFLHGLPSREATHLGKNGEKLEFLVCLSHINYWKRRAILSINRDIREIKRLHAATAASEQKFRLLIQNISEIVALIDADGIVLFISPQVERVLGVAAADVFGHDVFEFVHPEDRPRARQEYAKTVSEPGEAVPSVLRLRDSSGNWVPFEIIANNQIAEPCVGGVIFTARSLQYRLETEQAIRRANADIGKHVAERTLELARTNAALRLENQQRRYTEKQLQESVSWLNATLESTADGILVVANDGKVRNFNRKFVEMWHFPASIMDSATEEELLLWAAPQVEHPEEFLESIQRLYASAGASFDVVRLKNGRIFERYSQPQTVGEHKAGRVWSFRDVTQAYWQQHELRQAQKMEAIGRLAGGVAHDFNNMLMLMSGYESQLLEDPQLSEASRAICQQLVAATKRAASLTRQLLAFSRKHPIAPGVVDLNEIVAGLEKMLPRLLADPVLLKSSMSPEAVPIYADRSQIELMIINLALNARDAMPQGGTLSMTTGSEKLEDSVHGEEASKSYAVLQVNDTGHGMSPDVSAHIFEPFFTTKGLGKGTGLGLSTVYGIVEQAGGHITFESEPGQGTTFHIYFPKAAAPAAGENQSEPPSPPRPGHETILLVEDEEGIRAMTRNYLQSAGYKVLEAENGPAAVRISREHPGTIDLLLTDILMPEMRGDELAKVVRRNRPDILVMFISGNISERKDPHAPLLEKPFSFPDLGRKVREILDDSKTN